MILLPMKLTTNNDLVLRKLLFLFFLSAVNFVFAQFSSEYEKYKSLYPNAYSVTINDITDIEIKLENDNVVIQENIFEEKILLSKSAKYSAKEELSYSSFVGIENLEASAVNFIDGKYQEEDVKNFSNSDKFSTSFYDDLKKTEFMYPGVTEGSKTKISYSRIIKDPRFLSGFFLGNVFPIINGAYQITVDNTIKIDFKKFNINESVNYTKKVGKKKTVYRWETKNMEAIKIETNAPNYQKEFPQVVPFITEYSTKNKTVNVCGSVENLYSWYYSLVKDVNTKSELSDSFKNTVYKIIEGKTTELEKVKAIYYWAQENIKYIAFEYELGGFIPREAIDVFNKKYGDCKDNSSILSAMLKVAGLKGNLTWIGTRDIPFSYEEMPTPAVDNHMILSYEDKEGNVYFLDATGRYIPLDMPTEFIQGKEALIGLGKDNFKIVPVPIVPANRNTVKDSIYIKIENKSLKGKGKLKLNGYPKVEIYNVLEKTSDSEKIKKYYNHLLEKGSDKFLITDFKETNKYSYDDAFIVDYEFTIADFLQKYNDETFINMNLFLDLSNLKTDDDREYGKEYKYQNFNKMTAVLEVPENLEINFIPENLVVSNEQFSCKIIYNKLNSNLLEYNLIIEQKFISLNLEQQQNLNQMIKKVAANYKNVVVLKEKK